MYDYLFVFKLLNTLDWCLIAHDHMQEEKLTANALEVVHELDTSIVKLWKTLDQCVVGKTLDKYVFGHDHMQEKKWKLTAHAH